MSANSDDGDVFIICLLTEQRRESPEEKSKGRSTQSTWMRTQVSAAITGHQGVVAGRGWLSHHSLLGQGASCTRNCHESNEFETWKVFSCLHLQAFGPPCPSQGHWEGPGGGGNSSIPQVSLSPIWPRAPLCPALFSHRDIKKLVGTRPVHIGPNGTLEEIDRNLNGKSMAGEIVDSIFGQLVSFQFKFSARWAYFHEISYYLECAHMCASI